MDDRKLISERHYKAGYTVCKEERSELGGGKP